MATDRDYDILIVGGFGHVGLPLGLVYAHAGLQVALYDVHAERGKMIRQGRMPFLEYDAQPLLAEVVGKTLHIADDLSAVTCSRTVIITIGTPVDEYLNPKLMPILELAHALTPHLQPDHHVILRSTIFPGTTQRLGQFWQDAGLDVQLSFCPERIVQGHAVRELRGLPQIVSGLTPQAVERSCALFGQLGVQSVVVAVQEAELAKLFSNAWRYIQFATANQFYMIATEHGADFQRIHEAMTFGYPRAADFPRPGFASGPCLLKDTLQLSAFYENNFALGHAAMLVNEGLPSFLVRRLAATHDLRQETVGILGMAFKKDIDDTRDSLSYKLGKLLRFHGANVLYSDEFAEDPTFISKEELVHRSSIIIVGVPHSAYRELTVPDHVRVIDLWGTIGRRHASQNAA